MATAGWRISRRQFFRTSCGMAAAFVALNEIYGNPLQPCVHVL
jgi:hypothetical protein